MMMKNIHLILVLILGLYLILPTPAHAVCTRCCSCDSFKSAVSTQIDRHQKWLLEDFWAKNLYPALKGLGTQVSASLAAQTASLGTFTDAQIQLDTMRDIQVMQAQAIKDYTPSESMCTFGSVTGSLAASDFKGRANALVLSQRSLDRQLGKAGTVAQTGSSEDRLRRTEQFKARFCDVYDFSSGMAAFCDTAKKIDVHFNRDIDFTRTVDARATLNVDLTEGTLTQDEHDIMALQTNLFANEAFERINANALSADSAQDQRMAYLDMRSLVAKRSVAENSFNTLIGQRSSGTGQSTDFLKAVMRSLGMSEAEAVAYLNGQSLGGGVNPSYNAQMEVLTKRLYQSPTFYADLMDKPANVDRQFATLQAFGLMQQRDIFETIQRSEVLLSLILEMEIGKYQDEIQNLRQRTGG
jgi:hypothetical protein